MKDFNPDRIDDVIHASRLRVSLMAILASVDHAEFTFLRDMTEATDGNIVVHLRRLEEAGYVKSSKRQGERRRVTDYALTQKGRQAFSAYVSHLAALAEKGRKKGER